MKKNILIFVILISGLILTGCSNDSVGTVTTSNVEQTEVYGFVNGCSLGKDGIIYQEGSLLHFVDFASGQGIVLCNKPNCKHIPYNSVSNPDPSCDAVLPFDGTVYSFIYNETLYAFVSAKNTLVYQREVSGSGWEKSMEIPYPIAPVNMKIEDNKLLMVVDEVKVDQETNEVETSPFVLKVNLEKHNYEEMSEAEYKISESAINLDIVGNDLYYQHIYLDDSYRELSDDELTKVTYEDYTYEIYKINLMDGNAKCIFNNKDNKEYGYIGVYDEDLYLYKGKQLLQVNTKTKEEKVLWTADNLILSGSVYNNIILLDETTGGEGMKLYAYNLEEKKVLQLKRPEGETIPSLYANGILLIGDFEGDSVIYKAIQIEDYLDGNTKSITQYQQKTVVED